MDEKDEKKEKREGEGGEKEEKPQEINIGKVFYKLYKKFHIQKDVKTIAKDLESLKNISKNVPTLSIKDGKAFVNEIESIKVSNAFREVDVSTLSKVHKVQKLDKGFINVIEDQSKHLTDNAVFKLKKQTKTLSNKLEKLDKDFAKLSKQSNVSAKTLEKSSTIKRFAKNLGPSLKKMVMIGGAAILIGGSVAVVSKALSSLQNQLSGCLISYRDPTSNALIVKKLMHLSTSQDTSLYGACPEEILKLLPEDMKPGKTPSTWNGECTLCPSSTFYDREDDTLDKYKIWCHSASLGDALGTLVEKVPELILGGAGSILESFGSILKLLPQIVIAIVVIVAIVLGFKFLSKSGGGDKNQVLSIQLDDRGKAG